MRSKELAIFIFFLLFFAAAFHRHATFAPGSPRGTPQQTLSADLSAAPADPCGLPLYTDSYSAFSIGKPRGWKVSVSDGGVMVTKDPGETIGVMVYPARLRADYSTPRLFKLFSGAVGGAVRKAGGTFSLSAVYDRGNVAGALATARVEGTTFLAPIWVEREPGFVTLKLYFAPKAGFRREEPMLRRVAGCFHRQTFIRAVAGPAGAHHRNGYPRLSAGALRPYASAWYRAMIPEGWRVTGESQNGIDIAAPDRTAGVSFAYLSSPFRTTPRDFAMQAVSRSFSGVSILRSSPLPSSVPGWQAASVEFEGVFQGRRVRGDAVGVVYNGYTAAYDMVYLKVAAVDRWQALHPLLARIADSIQITQGNVGSAISAQNSRFNSLESHIESNEEAENASIMGSWAYRQHTEDVESQKWENATLGWEEVRSPSTGEKYDAPMDSWWATGPEGPGYYRKLPGAGGGYEKLEQVTR